MITSSAIPDAPAQSYQVIAPQELSLSLHLLSFQVFDLLRHQMVWGSHLGRGERACPEHRIHGWLDGTFRRGRWRTVHPLNLQKGLVRGLGETTVIHYEKTDVTTASPTKDRFPSLYEPIMIGYQSCSEGVLTTALTMAVLSAQMVPPGIDYQHQYCTDHPSQTSALTIRCIFDIGPFDDGAISS